MAGAGNAGGTRAAFAVVTSLFFAWGLVTSLIDPLVAAVKGVFRLTDLEAQLSASAFFIAYGVMSFPAAALLARLRPVATVLAALALMGAGCLVMLAAANLAVYPLVLLGLFVLASGITVLQVAANPLAAGLGRPARSHLRPTLSQTVNSLGTFIGPTLGAALFLRGVEVKGGAAVTPAARAAALGGIDSAFLGIAAFLALLALFIFSARHLLTRAAPATAPAGGVGATLRAVAGSRWALLGGAAIFLYVGAEVSIGTQMALFLNSDAVLGVPLAQAGRMVSLYWGGAMVGRLLGTVLLARLAAARLLAAFTAAAGGLCLFVAASGGPAAGYAALCIGLFNSIMFPVIFTLTLERSTAGAAATSGFLCFAIVGGAALPPLTGLVSGSAGYAAAFLVPATCYALLLLFALASGRAQVQAVASGPAPH